MKTKENQPGQVSLRSIRSIAVNRGQSRSNQAFGSQPNARQLAGGGRACLPSRARELLSFVSAVRTTSRPALRERAQLWGVRYSNLNPQAIIAEGLAFEAEEEAVSTQPRTEERQSQIGVGNY